MQTQTRAKLGILFRSAQIVAVGVALVLIGVCYWRWHRQGSERPLFYSKWGLRERTYFNVWVPDPPPIIDLNHNWLGVDVPLNAVVVVRTRTRGMGPLDITTVGPGRALLQSHMREISVEFNVPPNQAVLVERDGVTQSWTIPADGATKIYAKLVSGYRADPEAIDFATCFGEVVASVTQKSPG